MNRNAELLRLVHPEAAPSGIGLQVTMRLHEGELQVDFEVRTPGPHFVNPALTGGVSHWGLWDWDVVELFLSVSDECYYEFQVSPLGQFFELQIFEPRKRFDRTFHSPGARFTASSLTPQGWCAQMRLPLQELRWDGNLRKLRGNAFAILGPPEQKTYWSLFLPQQARPDFHRPEFFQQLFL